MNKRKNTSIRSEAELIHQFGQLLAQQKEIPWIPQPELLQGAPVSVDLNFDGRRVQFRPKYLLTPTAGDIVSLIANEKSQTLLVVPRLTSALLDLCRKHRVSVVDLNGRTYLRARGLLIDRGPVPGRDFRFELEPRNVFVGKSVRIVRTLLTDPAKLWTQTEIVKRSGASSGLVSRITTHLLRQGLLRKTDARRFHLISSSLLLDAWAESDDFGRRVTTQRYSALSGNPVELATKLQSELTSEPEPMQLAFTQWVAAWLRHPYTEPPVISAYISRLPSRELAERIGLRPVSDAGRVWLHVPNDAGVFLEGQTVQNLPLVTDAQIYIDLLKTGLRGPDQAQALREWEGFCRP